MILIIHGEDLASSRQHYLTQKGKAKNKVEFMGNKLTLPELIQSMSGGSLFNEEKSIFIENLLGNKKLSDTKEIIDYIKKNHKNFEIYLWENTELSKTILSQFSNSTIKIFKLPQNLFAFLDNIKPKNKNNIMSFHKALENSNEELIFFMLIRQFRLMLSIFSGGNSIDEPKRLAPWQKEKFKRQANLFTEQEIIGALKKLHEIDYAQKSGLSNLSLIQAIDIFLLEI
jgi:hypothetical protein